MKSVLVLIAQELSCGILLLYSSSWRRGLFVEQGLEDRFLMCNPIRRGRKKRTQPSFLGRKPCPDVPRFAGRGVLSRCSSFPVLPRLLEALSGFILFIQRRRWLRVGLWLQCGDTACLPGQEEVNLSGYLGRERVPKSRLPGHMAAQVRLFCRTKSKVVWEARIFRDYRL